MNLYAKVKILNGSELKVFANLCIDNDIRLGRNQLKLVTTSSTKASKLFHLICF